MERAGKNGGIVERILSGSAPAVLLGPAASGKTTAALAIYRRFERNGTAACLLLAPNFQAAAQLRRRLLDESPSGVIVAPQVGTFAALAGRILAAAGDAGRLLSPLRRHLLLSGVVDELVASGKLPALAAVADTPGLVVALDRAIAELKRAAVEPAALEKALRRGDEKGRELLAVYARYQEHMLSAGVYDVEGQMWRARDCLAVADEPPGLEGIEAVAADGFTDFTPTQLEMLALLAERGKRVVVTLPYADDGRERLWHWTGRTLDNIRRKFGRDLREFAEGADDAADGAAFKSLLDRVFDFDAAPCELPAGLGVIAAPDVEAEVAAVARRVKGLILESGAPRIAVLARSMEAYREPIERIFAAHDIPLTPAPQALTDVPIVRFVLNAANLAPDFAYRDVLGVITNSYFSPDALGDFDAATVAAAQMVIREGNVLAGREAYANAARRLAERPTEAAEDEDEPRVALGPMTFAAGDILKAGRMLERLFDLSAGRGAGAERIAGIVDGLRLDRTAAGLAEPDLVARDLRALAALRGALAQLDDDTPPSRLREALAAVACPAARAEGMVDVMDVLDARSLRYDHVFLLGLGEGQFPHRFTEGPLVSEADRLAWADRGVVLDNRGDLTAREMLLFYLAASRPDATLTLSYTEADASGSPKAPSSFLESLLAPAGGMEAEAVKRITEKIPAGRFVPPAGRLSSRRDAPNVAIAGLFEGENKDSPGALAWIAESDPALIDRVSRGLWAESRRNTRAPCDAFDGRIAEAPLLETLSRRFGAKAVFSATQLNTYGQCPWQFFAAYVLELAALREPERRLEPVARGIFCHDVLFRVMSDLSSKTGGPVRLWEIDEPTLTESLDGAIAAASAEIEKRQPPYPALWRLQRNEMHAALREYLLACRQQSQLAPESIHFELGFALPAGRPAEHLDPASRDEPARIATDAGEVRIRGKIDRVDRVSFAGREGILVIDYKTGRPPSAGDIREGRNLQIPLYLAAAEQILSADGLGGAFHQIGAQASSYEKLFAAVKRRGDKYTENGEYAQQLAQAMSRVGEFVAGIRGGRFDALPTHACPSYCPFGQICRYSEWRAELKTADEEGDS